MQTCDARALTHGVRWPRPCEPQAERAPDGYCFGPFELIPARWELRRSGTAVALSRTPFRLLLYLVEHRDRVVSAEELLQAVWPDSVVSDASLASGLKNVRRALGDDGGQQRWIRTLRRRGYQFVDRLAAEPCAAPQLAGGTLLVDLSGVPGIQEIARAIAVRAQAATPPRNAWLILW